MRNIVHSTHKLTAIVWLVTYTDIGNKKEPWAITLAIEFTKALVSAESFFSSPVVAQKLFDNFSVRLSVWNWQNENLLASDQEY